MSRDLILVALGGNALKGRHKFQHFPELARACEAMAEISSASLLVTHGNGPQIGNLAYNGNDRAERTLDVLGAETEGLLGYQIEQELGNYLPRPESVVTLLTRVEVDENDDAFRNPVKPIGPLMSREKARELEQSHRWEFLEHDGQYRRLVPSPKPRNILQLETIKELLNSGKSVICAGGGGIPVSRNSTGQLVGVEAVIDKDFASSLLARKLGASTLFLVTDVAGVYSHWDTPQQSRLATATPSDLRSMKLPAGSMGPKVEAACEFVEATGNKACIGALAELTDLLQGKAGTWIEADQRQVA